MPTPFIVSNELVARLYRLADRLRMDWANVPLREDFDTSMIMGVINVLERVGNRRKDGTRRSAQEQVVFAERLLRHYWKKNASRDFKRYTRRKETGGISEIVSLDVVGEFACQVSLYQAAGDDLWGGDTGRATLQFLLERGWMKEAASAIVWRLGGRPWDDVTFLLEERFEVVLTPDQARQWQKRFARVQEDLRLYLMGDDGATADMGVKPGTPKRPGSARKPEAAQLAEAACEGADAATGVAAPDSSTPPMKRKPRKQDIITMRHSVNIIALITGQKAPGARMAAVLGLAAITGCGPAPQPRTVIAGIDTSAGWHDHLAQGVSAIAAQAQCLDADRDHISIYRMDVTSREFTGELALDDPDRLTTEIIRQAGRQPARRGTYPARFFAQAVPQAEAAPGPCVVEITSDCDNDDASPETRADLRKLGTRLSNSRNVTGVWFFGISPENRAYWRDVFSALGSRLHFCSPDQLTDEHAVEAVPPG